MKRFSLLSLAALLLAWSAAAQSGTQAQSQTNAAASSNTSVNAGKSGVNAQNNTSASASQNTSAQRSGGSAKKGKSQAGATGQASSSQSASAGSGSASAVAGTTLNAVLTRSVDARKAKEGDEVTAKTTSAAKAGGQTTIPKGAKLIGHVTKANARAKGDSESALGIVFDRAEFGKGQQVPVHAVVQALAVARQSAAISDEPMPSASPSGGAPSGGGMAGGGGLIGGAVSGVGNTVSNTAGAVANTSTQMAGSAGGALNGAAGSVGAAASSTLSASSRGVVGLPGYALDAAAASATQGSVVTSTGKNVKLDSGTQMVLRIVSE